MKSAAQIDSHPIHPMLVGFPIAYLGGGAAVDVWARVTDRRSWFATALRMNALGLGAALAAALPGLVDYVFRVPPKSSARTRATDHMIANLSALSLFALARAGRGPGDRPSAWAMAAELGGVGLLLSAGWMGGTLVYRNQIGVDHRYAGAGRWNEQPITPGSQTLDVADARELGVGQMKLLHVGPRRVVLARAEQGFAAFDDRCSHKGGPLADGALVCGTVQCPWHGSQFDVASGVVKNGPAHEPVASYPVVERGGRVFVTIPDGTPLAS